MIFCQRKSLKNRIDMVFRRIGFYVDLGEMIDIPDYLSSDERKGFLKAVYRLPMGLHPDKVEKAMSALQMALEASIDYRLDGRILMIEGYTTKIPERVEFSSSYLTKGKIAPVLNIGQSKRGIESVDYAKVPNPFMLIGSAPGMGKSNAINVMLPQLIYQGVDLYIGDPKLDFTEYKKLCTHETDHKDIIDLVEEVSRKVASRQKWINAKGYKNILEYNSHESEPLEYIFLVIDEIADFDPKDENFWEPVTHIVRKGRSAGVAFIAATQRASTDMFSSTVKSNILLRLAFKTSTVKNSEIILESNSAFYLPTLPGRGILLNGLEREIQVPHIKDVRKILDEIKKANDTGSIADCSRSLP